MIKQLRKRHLQIWTVLAVIIPVGIITAWLTIPKAAKDKLLQPSSVQAFPLILKMYSSIAGYEVNIRASADSSQLQLEWKNKQTLTYPTATIYAMPANDSNVQHGRLIGRIEARGNYYFPLDPTFKPATNSTYHLLLYDFIHKQIIDTINF